MAMHRPHTEYYGCNVIPRNTYGDTVDPTINPAEDRGAIVAEIRHGIENAEPPGRGEGELDSWHRYHLSRYTEGSSHLNGWLGRNKMYRGGRDLRAPGKFGAPIRCLVEAIQHLFCGRLNRVWKGIALTDTQLATYVVGHDVQWQAFTSTSLSKNVAISFAVKETTHAKEPVLFEIRRDRKRPTAARIDGFSDYPSEKEVLMIPGCRFEVIDRFISDQGFKQVVLEEVDSPYKEMGWI